jgi:uncharacterized membrane protein YfcA
MRKYKDLTNNDARIEGVRSFIFLVVSLQCFSFAALCVLLVKNQVLNIILGLIMIIFGVLYMFRSEWLWERAFKLND